MSIGAFWLAHCRRSEKIVIAYFTYTAVLSFVNGLPVWQRLFCSGIPVVLFVLACLETIYGTTPTGIARDWVLPATVLAGYWQMGWFAGTYDLSWERRWLDWDRHVLNGMGVRAFVESLSWTGPWILELCYLSLYAIPPACIGVIYWRRERVTLDRFLTTFALATMTAYALLPVIAVESPRIAFPGQDLPAMRTFWRSINLWVLQHLDISTSVFPSGHVAVAFSSALGLKRALPDSQYCFRFFLMLAGLVFLATVYGRYHYAADGVMSIIICLTAWQACELYEKRG